MITFFKSSNKPQRLRHKTDTFHFIKKQPFLFKKMYWGFNQAYISWLLIV